MRPLFTVLATRRTPCSCGSGPHGMDLDGLGSQPRCPLPSRQAYHDLLPVRGGGILAVPGVSQEKDRASEEPEAVSTRYRLGCRGWSPESAFPQLTLARQGAVHRAMLPDSSGSRRQQETHLGPKTPTHSHMVTRKDTHARGSPGDAHIDCLPLALFL